MKNIAAGFTVLAILCICLLGMAAALLGCWSLDRWCARQLADMDGQES